MAKVQLKGKFPKRPEMKGKQYDVAKFTIYPNLADTFNVTIGGAFAPLMAIEDQYINKIYEQFKIETNKITQSIVGIKKIQKRKV